MLPCDRPSASCLCSSSTHLTPSHLQRPSWSIGRSLLACRGRLRPTAFPQVGCQINSFSNRSRGVKSNSFRVLCATRQQQPQKNQRPSSNKGAVQKAGKPAKGRLADAQEVADEAVKWRFFDASAYNQGWEVPWGQGATALGMFLWAVSFVLVGLLVVPLLGFELGVQDFGGLTQTEKAYYALVNQVLETVVGIGTIALVTAKSKPFPKDVFKFDLRYPFRTGDGWLAWGTVGVAWAPVVVGVTALVAAAVGYDNLGGKGTVDGVAQIITLNTPTYLSLLSVTSILAPVLEETVFRGFLLTSLTKYMPTWAAVLISSGFFGAAHLSVRDLPQLVALGIVLGFSYVRSRNLATPMLIHGVWNGTVLSILFLLVSSGIDVTDFM